MKQITFLISVLCLIYCVGFSLGNVPKDRSSKRVNLPFLGIGKNCGRGCPKNFCDDDEAIIYGYCCGCARFFDKLPVRCSNQIRCPGNTFDLCEDYEYMMHCCC